MCSSAKSKVFGGIPSALPKIEFRISFFKSVRLEVGADKLRRDSSLQVNDLLAEAPAKQ